jgi:hypothetical protein
VAGVAERLAADRGVALPAALRLWDLAGGRPDTPRGRLGPLPAAPAPDGACGPAASAATVGGEPSAAPPAPGPGQAGAGGDGAGELARALELATSDRDRQTAGLHVTPRWLADHLVELALGGGPNSAGRAGPAVSACDPACGGGVFLVAAAAAVHARGVPPAEAVRRLWGADIDPVGVAAAEVALALWSGGAVPPPGQLVVGDPLRDGVGAWPERPGARFDLVVGNPPFQSQLGRATARPADDRRRLRDRYGEAVRAYTDTAWLFLLLGCDLARPGGRVVLVQPDSLVAARDAAAVRAAVDRMARVDDLWVDDRRVFAAAVRVCAPILTVTVAAGTGDDVDGSGPTGAARRRDGVDGSGPTGAARGRDDVDGPGPTGAADRAPTAGPGDPATGRWHDLLADATGIPAARLAATGGRLRDRATVAAGFRDEYYGLVDLVREVPPDQRPSPAAPLVTAGIIDWGRSAWGHRPLRFAKRRWAAPEVDLARLSAAGSPAARRWVARTRVPKVVVATQTRVVEVAVDEAGTWVPSVPVLAVVPHRPDDLWRLAAALAAPAATAWLARRAPGAALARGAIKMAAGDLADLPLPVDERAWDAAAAAFRDVAGTPGAGALDAYAAAAAAAYDSPGPLVEWWRERLGVADRSYGAVVSDVSVSPDVSSVMSSVGSVSSVVSSVMSVDSVSPSSSVASSSSSEQAAAPRTSPSENRAASRRRSSLMSNGTLQDRG